MLSISENDKLHVGVGIVSYMQYVYFTCWEIGKLRDTSLKLQNSY